MDIDKVIKFIEAKNFEQAIHELVQWADNNDDNAHKDKILFLASNPKETKLLGLKKEYDCILESINKFHSSQFKLHSQFDVTPTDFIETIIEFSPKIIHFSGHGIGEDTKNSRGLGKNPNEESDLIKNGIVLQTEKGTKTIVSSEDIKKLFETVKRQNKQLEVVILNSCYSIQANAIAENVPYVIGTKNEIYDNIAISFSKWFYLGLSAANDVEIAFELARTSISIMGFKDSDILFLHRKKPTVILKYKKSKMLTASFYLSLEYLNNIKELTFISTWNNKKVRIDDKIVSETNGPVVPVQEFEFNTDFGRHRVDCLLIVTFNFIFGGIKSIKMVIDNETIQIY